MWKESLFCNLNQDCARMFLTLELLALQKNTYSYLHLLSDLFIIAPLLQVSFVFFSGGSIALSRNILWLVHQLILLEFYNFFFENPWTSKHVVVYIICQEFAHYFEIQLQKYVWRILRRTIRVIPEGFSVKSCMLQYLTYNGVMLILRDLKKSSWKI